MNIRNITLVAGLVAIAGVANAQSFELRAGAGVQSIVGNTIRIQPGGGAFTVQIWAILPTPTSNVSANVALGYAFSNATANNNATDATAVNNKLGAWSYQTVQTLMSPVIVAGNAVPAGLRRSTSSATSNFTHSGFTGVQSISRGYSSGLSPVTFSGAIHMSSVTFTGNTLALNEIYGDDANEFGLQVLTNGSTSAPSGAGFTGFGGNGQPLPLGSQRYRVEAVPEPATMAALGLGLAAMARRRRNKK